MPNQTTRICAILLLATSIALAATPPPTTQSEPENSSEALLAKRVPDARFTKNKLIDVIDFLADTTGGNFYVDWKNLASVGVTKSTPVTIAVQDKTLAVIVSQILSNVSGESVTFKVIGHVIVISTDDGLKTLTDAQALRLKAIDERLQAALDKKQPDVRFNANGFVDVVGYLTDTNPGAPIKVDWPAFQKLGIAPNTPVSLHLHNVTLHETLELMFQQVASEKGRPILSIDGDVILISAAPSK